MMLTEKAELVLRTKHGAIYGYTEILLYPRHTLCRKVTPAQRRGLQPNVCGQHCAVSQATRQQALRLSPPQVEHWTIHYLSYYLCIQEKGKQAVQRAGPAVTNKQTFWGCGIITVHGPEALAPGVCQLGNASLLPWQVRPGSKAAPADCSFGRPGSILLGGPLSGAPTKGAVYRLVLQAFPNTFERHQA
ncbi:hypothetical protein EYF80_016793 [Liparis tanakae]|uniref:Uncharacterized protein n=1 Tax=Liparis tanakae TaxID=230148 RepID=A0A4Z2I752_9TELE|nr:hypothetical protein EYF80_016793 [Liparis tanakae]